MKVQFDPNPEAWRHDPDFASRASTPGYPDDLQVVVHDGGYRKTQIRPEVMWVHTTGRSGDYFRGNVLNVPHQLTSVSQGSEIYFRIHTGCQHAIRQTESVIAEADEYIITPCDKCGCFVLFDAPSELFRLTFPDMEKEGGQMAIFTTFCNICGGLMAVKSKAG